MNHEHEDFDSLLENSLQTYANAEPRPGLQERILARTVAQQPALSPHRRATPNLWGWLAAGACAALVAVAVYPHFNRAIRISARRQPSSISSPPLTSPAPMASVIPALTPAPTQKPPSHRPAPPRAKALPTQPTSQEKLLAEFLSTHQKEALLLASAQAHEQASLDQPVAPKPIASTPIEIRPIQISSIPGRPIVIDPIQKDSTQVDR